MIEYAIDRTPSVAQFEAVLRRSTLAERRPVDDRACLEGMVAHADLWATAWDGDELVGVARSVTDFHYCCYLSDLAVDAAHQRSGIGRGLVAATRRRLGPRCTLILIAAPAAADYYGRIGLTAKDGCWVLRPGDEGVGAR